MQANLVILVRFSHTLTHAVDLLVPVVFGSCICLLLLFHLLRQTLICHIVGFDLENFPVERAALLSIPKAKRVTVYVPLLPYMVIT